MSPLKAILALFVGIAAGFIASFTVYSISLMSDNYFKIIKISNKYVVTVGFNCNKENKVFTVLSNTVNAVGIYVQNRGIFVCNTVDYSTYIISTNDTHLIYKLLNIQDFYDCMTKDIINKALNKNIDSKDIIHNDTNNAILLINKLCNTVQTYLLNSYNYVTLKTADSDMDTIVNIAKHNVKNTIINTKYAYMFSIIAGILWGFVVSVVVLVY